MTKTERILWDFAVRNLSTVGIARKYKGMTKIGVEQLIKANWKRVSRYRKK